MCKNILLLIIAIFSLSVNAMDSKLQEEFDANTMDSELQEEFDANANNNKRKEEFDDGGLFKKQRKEIAIPSLPNVIWGKIFYHLSQEEKIKKRAISKIHKKQIDNNTHFLEIPGELENVTSLERYLTSLDLKVSHLFFTGDLTSRPVFQAVATTIGKELLSLKGLRNDLAEMFEQGQCFDEIFPKLENLEATFLGHNGEICQHRKPNIFNENQGPGVRWGLLGELSPKLKELKYERWMDRIYDEELQNWLPGIDEEEGYLSGIEVVDLFEQCPNIEKIDLFLECFDDVSFDHLPKSVKELRVLMEKVDKINSPELIQSISQHENIKILHLDGFYFDENGSLPKNLTELYLDSANKKVNKQIFTIISQLPYLKKLKLFLVVKNIGKSSLYLPCIEELEIQLRYDNNYDGRKKPVFALRIPKTAKLKVHPVKNNSHYEDVKIDIEYCS